MRDLLAQPAILPAKGSELKMVDEEPAAYIKAGDIVRLKSGGPPMTVTYLTPGYRIVGCHWFWGPRQQEGEFRDWELVKADSPNGATNLEIRPEEPEPESESQPQLDGLEEVLNGADSE
jgi:uncharacterized protein YodC (DUF2158 family)